MCLLVLPLCIYIFLFYNRCHTCFTVFKIYLCMNLRGIAGLTILILTIQYVHENAEKYLFLFLGFGQKFMYQLCLIPFALLLYLNY